MRTLILAGLLLTNLVALLPQMACAKDFRQVNTGELPPSPWFKDRLHVQILNTDPTVHDLRQPVDNTRYVINVGPVPAGNTNTVVLPAGGYGNGGMVSQGAGGGGVSSGAPQSIVIDPSQLPQSGFESNIPAHRFRPGNLPSGNSTNMLAGRMSPPAVATAPSIQHQGPHPQAISAPLVTSRPVVSVYNDKPSSFAENSASNQVQTRVSGTLKRHSLLGQ